MFKVLTQKKGGSFENNSHNLVSMKSLFCACVAATSEFRHIFIMLLLMSAN
jgi:hypothetical protein